MMAFLRALPLLWQLSFVFSLITAIGVVYGIWHHTVYKSGEDACQARYTAATVAQNATAQKQILTIGGKYVQIESDISKKDGFSVPVSPLVADTIGRMPDPSPRAK